MAVGSILTFGYGSFGTVNKLPTLGFLSGAVPPAPPPSAVITVPGIAGYDGSRDGPASSFHGGEDRREGYEEDYFERRVKRMAKIKQEDETLLKIIVKMVTNGTLQ